jgi:hypothetical protein
LRCKNPNGGMPEVGQGAKYSSRVVVFRFPPANLSHRQVDHCPETSILMKLRLVDSSTSYGSRQRSAFISMLTSALFAINQILKSLPTGIPFPGLATGIPTHISIRTRNGRSFGLKRRGSLLHKERRLARLILQTQMKTRPSGRLLYASNDDFPLLSDFIANLDSQR